MSTFSVPAEPPEQAQSALVRGQAARSRSRDENPPASGSELSVGFVFAEGRYSVADIHERITAASTLLAVLDTGSDGLERFDRLARAPRFDPFDMGDRGEQMFRSLLASTSEAAAGTVVRRIRMESPLEVVFLIGAATTTATVVARRLLQVVDHFDQLRTAMARRKTERAGEVQARQLIAIRQAVLDNLMEEMPLTVDLSDPNQDDIVETRMRRVTRRYITDLRLDVLESDLLEASIGRAVPLPPPTSGE